MKRFYFCLALLLAWVIAIPVFAQNVASQKAYFGSETNELISPNGDVGLYAEIKTSGVGDLLIGVSMECALWTGTSNTAKKGGDKTTSKSRAAVNVTVYVNGVAATPGKVVYCDREQEVNLQFISDDTINFTNDAILLEMFLRTKNANHFNFYVANPGSGVHKVSVWVDSFVEMSEGAPATVVANTRAAIGKRTLVVQEYNNP